MLAFSVKLIEHQHPDGIKRIVKFNKPLGSVGSVVAYVDIYGPFHTRSAEGDNHMDAATKLARLLKGELLVDRVTQINP